MFERNAGSELLSGLDGRVAGDGKSSVSDKGSRVMDSTT